MKITKELPAADYVLATVGVAVSTGALWMARGHLEKSYAPLLYLLLIVATARMAGVGPAILVAILSFICWNFFFINPILTFYVDSPNDVLALIVFLIVGVVCGQLAGRARQADQVEILREADKLKSALLTSVSHDLRTPLASIKAAVTSLRRSDRTLDASSQSDLTASIDQAADQLDRVIGDLLDLASIEAGAWKPGHELNDLTDVVGAVRQRFSESANERIQVLLPPELTLIPMDHVYVAQVLWNLIDNALKYSPPNEPVVVSARNNRKSVTISIIDKGPGIPPGESQRVFDKFYRARVRVESHVPGTGMGLAICKGIVEAHGGRIWVTNGEEAGATFFFTLPTERSSVGRGE